MTTLSPAAPATAASAAVRPYVSPVTASGVSFPRVLRSEWTKLRSLRSTWVTLGIAMALMVGLAALVSSVVVGEASAAQGPLDAMSVALAGSAFASVALGALGVMTMTSEYSSGSIRSTVLSVPKRTPVLVAKAVLLAAVSYVSMLVAVVASYAVSMSILASKGLDVSLGDEGVWRVLLGSPAYLALVALLGLGIGALLRSTPGGITTVLGLVLVVPPLASLLPGRIGETLSHWLPSAAGQQVTLLTPDPAGLGPWTGLGVMAGYAVGLLVVAAVLLRRRDA